MAKKNVTKRISGASIPSIDPEDLELVLDEKHLLFDDRVHLPTQEPLVLSIMAHGVLEAVTVVRDGNTLLVADGRQRVKNAREANRRLKAQGALPVRVPYVCRRGRDEKILGVMASTFIRTEDSPVSRAHKMLKHVEIGRTTGEIAVDFGCTAKVVKTTLALLDCASAVQKAVDAGEIPLAVSRTLSALPRAEQGPALAKMRALGDLKGAKAKAAAAEATGRKPPGPKMLSRRDVLAIRMRLDAQRIHVGIGKPSSEFAAQVLRFVLGEDEDFAIAHPWHAGRETDGEPAQRTRTTPSKDANGASGANGKTSHA